MEPRCVSHVLVILFASLQFVTCQDSGVIRLATAETPSWFLTLGAGNTLQFTIDANQAKTFVVEQPGLDGESKHVSIKEVATGQYIRLKGTSFYLETNTGGKTFSRQASFELEENKFHPDTSSYYSKKYRAYLANRRGKLGLLSKESLRSITESVSFRQLNPHTLPWNLFPTTSGLSWSDCSVSCGGGFQTALFRCRGSRCRIPCNVMPCEDITATDDSPVPTTDNRFRWTPCSKSCGGGSQEALFPCRGTSCFRRCNEQECPGITESTRPTFTGPMIPARQWSECSKSCGGGNQRAIFPCFGSSCFRQCNIQQCPSGPGPTEPTDTKPTFPTTRQLWTPCNRPCGGGTQAALFPCRGRSCQRRCNTDKCSREPVDTAQPERWTTCSTTCGRGVQIKIQLCPFGCSRVVKGCQIRPCSRPRQGECSKPCGGGIIVRSRRGCRTWSCAQPTIESCNTHPCEPVESIGMCHENPCEHGECEEGRGGYKCVCDNEYTGDLCNNLKDDAGTDACAENPCENGECTVTPDGFTCKCDDGYTGERCDQEDDTGKDACSGNPCENGACAVISVGYLCICHHGYRGERCDQEDDSGMDACTENPCANGECAVTSDGFTCKCYDGYRGKRCLQEDDSGMDACTENPCANGECAVTSEGFTCKCHDGYTGERCDQEDIISDSCSANPCVFGICKSTDDIYECKCNDGYTGMRCDEVIDHCEPSPCVFGDCQNAAGSYKCVCSSGYTGADCSEVIDFCEDSPCVYGTCSGHVGGFSCTCDPSYTGKKCSTQIDFCGNDPCDHGECLMKDDGFECICFAGYEGERCGEEIDHCSSDPCSHGTCSNSPTGFSCECDAGYTSEKCDEIIVDSCNPNPCAHDATCVPSGDSYTCACPFGYDGRNCETDIATDFCNPNPCQNNGTCVKLRSTYWCRCNLGYKGYHCENYDDWEVYSPCTKTCGGGSQYIVHRCPEGEITKCRRTYKGCNYQACPINPTCLQPGLSYMYKSTSECCSTTSESQPCGHDYQPFVAQRIIGGYLAEFGKWPWAVRLQLRTSARTNSTCGSVLIHPQWLVTAGHCVHHLTEDIIHAVLGTTNHKANHISTQYIDIEEILVHPDFSFPNSDIALLKLKTPAIINKLVRPICLPGGEKTAVDKKCFAVGWGIATVEDVITAKTSDNLMEVGLNKLDFSVCDSGYRGTGVWHFMDHKMLCAGSVDGGVDTCMGDSGGPLMCQRCSSCSWYLAGITSFGAKNCNIPDRPGVYTNLLFFEEWIRSHVPITENAEFSCSEY